MIQEYFPLLIVVSIAVILGFIVAGWGTCLDRAVRPRANLLRINRA